MRLIERKHYLEQLIAAKGTPDIKVITGVRRCGKATLLEPFISYAQKNDPDANIIHVNFSLPEYEHLLTCRALYDYVSGRYRKGTANYVMIDEVQMCESFVKALNWLHAEERYDISVTGSNAFLQSSDLAALLTGRIFEIKLYPFSLAEFAKYFELDNAYEAFGKYLAEGGIPGSCLHRGQKARHDCIAAVFDTLIVRDIRQRYKIRNIPLPGRTAEYLRDNISHPLSARSIAGALSGNKDNVSHRTVSAYLEYLCQAFAFCRVPRYDIRQKKHLASHDKYYLCDHAFRYAKSGAGTMDDVRALENIAAIELMRRGYRVYAGMLYHEEIDFVAMKRSEKLYIQVSDNITDEKTSERETSPLLKIRDAHPKLILARTRHGMTDYEGIQIIDVADWLLSRKIPAAEQP